MKNLFLIWMLNIILTNCTYASTPLWTFTPLTPTTISIRPLEVKFIDYLITNQSSITHTLSIQEYAFPVVTSGEFNCGSLFTLQPNQSCILSFYIHGLPVDSSYRGGPVLCESGSQDLCYRPSEQDILTVIYKRI